MMQGTALKPLGYGQSLFILPYGNKILRTPHPFHVILIVNGHEVCRIRHSEEGNAFLLTMITVRGAD